ncbi:MAG: dienelactone hydrolase family protein [Acidimicrobiales bacterium]
MIEQFFDLTTADGDMPVFSVRPDGDGPYPVVVFLMDAPGMREELRDMCRRLASAGYYLIAPQLYYRKVREFNVFETEDRDTMFELMNSLSNTMVDGDVGDLLAHLAKDLATGTAVRHHDPAADTSRVGTVGYCMSGPFAITAAAAFPDQVKAAASIHGVRLATEFDDSPHRSLARSNAEVYIGCAETDHWAPPELIAEFEAAMAEHGTRGRVEWNPGTEHGYAFSQRPSYDKAASEQHWERLHDLFRRNIG